MKNKLNLEHCDKNLIWHPFTQMKYYEKEKPLIIESGKGSFLKDIYGNEYIDGVSSLWVNIHGHRKEEIDNAIIKQIKKISHSTLLGLANVPSIGLAKELLKIIPSNLKKVFYSDNGSTAVEIALKIAFQYWQNKGFKNKTKFISLQNAYHGDTIGSVSVGGIGLFHKKFGPFLFSTYKSPSYYCYRCKFISAQKRKEVKFQKSPFFIDKPSCNWECIEKAKEIIKKNNNKIAGFIMEPLVQGAGGIIVSSRGYLTEISKLCKKYNVLLILDEVATGFGRTGKMFACEHENVKPDILALAKGITGGYLPLSVTLSTEGIYKAFLGKYEEEKTFFHGHSYTGNQLACSAAIANLQIFEKEKTIKKLQEKIKILHQELSEFVNMKYVGNIRQCGFMAAIELVKDNKKMLPLEKETVIRLCYKAREYGLIIRPLGNVIVIMPPLSISIKDLKKMLYVIKIVLEE
jgi:adenosylmethionine-8-amino-7-oxononanoate transaminase